MGSKLITSVHCKTHIYRTIPELEILQPWKKKIGLIFTLVH